MQSSSRLNDNREWRTNGPLNRGRRSKLTGEVVGKTRDCGLRVLRGSNGWNAGDCYGESPRFTRRSSSL